MDLQLLSTIIKTIIILLLGLPTVWIGTRFLSDKIQEKVSTHVGLLVGNFLYYGGCLLLFFLVLTQLGFNISALLGAAGIVGVAVGFASQTSISNMISGIFLVIEQPFKIGDFIVCGSTAGRIISIDLLSVRLRTSDGMLIRIPNEMLIKSAVVNKTFYNARRITLIVSVPNKEDKKSIIELTDTILKDAQMVLEKPVPSISYDQVGTWFTEFNVQFWVKSTDVIWATAQVVELLEKSYEQKNLALGILVKN